MCNLSAEILPRNKWL